MKKDFEYYFIERNGLWQERLDEVKTVGFELASPIARLIYSCEVGQIDQHASEDLKVISAMLAVIKEKKRELVACDAGTLL